MKMAIVYAVAVSFSILLFQIMNPYSNLIA